MQRVSKCWNDMKNHGKQDIIKYYCMQQDDVQEMVF